MRSKLMWVAAALVAGLFSCDAPAPARNKLPGYSKAPVGGVMGRPKMLTLSDGGSAGNCLGVTQFPFEMEAQPAAISVDNSDEFIGGSIRSCICVNLSNPAQDGQLMEMAKSLEALAIPTLLKLSVQSRNAVVVDLRSITTEHYMRAEYEVSGPGFKLPLAVKWDLASSGRAANLMAKAREIAGIEITQTADEYNF